MSFVKLKSQAKRDEGANGGERAKKKKKRGDKLGEGIIVISRTKI